MNIISQKIISLSLLLFLPTIIYTDNISPYGSKRPLPEPVIFGEGVLSTDDGEFNAAFTPDGKSIYFTKRIAQDLMVILVSNFKAGKWTSPEVASFSGQYNEYDPFLSPDGSKLFYCSHRPIAGGGTTPKKDSDIWMVERTNTGWSEPKHLDATVNTDTNEYYPSIAANGALYFGSERKGGKGEMDLYRSELIAGKYSEPEHLGGDINTEKWEGDSYIAPDESYLIFLSSNRPEGFGGGDLYITYKKDGAWTKAKNLGPLINSSVMDFCPIVSPDGKYFFFSSRRGYFDKPLTTKLNYAQLKKHMRSIHNGKENIYQVDINILNLYK